MNKTKVLATKKLYKGYFDLFQYDLSIPSFDEHKEYLTHANRELLKTSDSILVLIYAPNIDSFVFCEEFRIGVFFNSNSNDEPFILECVAGTIEENESPEETAIKEVREETGLHLKKLRPITAVYKSPGIMTEKSHLYYAEVDGEPQSGIHGIGSEEIKTHILSRATIYQSMDEGKIYDSATLIALQWFRLNEHNDNSSL